MSNVIELRPKAQEAKKGFLTPREVERRYPALSRPILASRRAFGLPPHFTLMWGCAMYEEAEIRGFLSTRRQVVSKAGKQRCKVYARADSLFETPDMVADQVEFCEAFRKGMGWADAGATVDFGLSNTPNSLLDGVHSLFDEAEKGEFDILLIRDLSHIGTGSGKELLRFIQQFDTSGVHVCEAARLGYGATYD